MREDDRVRIKHMIDAAESVERFIAGGHAVTWIKT